MSSKSRRNTPKKPAKPGSVPGETRTVLQEIRPKAGPRPDTVGDVPNGYAASGLELPELQRRLADLVAGRRGEDQPPLDPEKEKLRKVIQIIRAPRTSQRAGEALAQFAVVDAVLEYLWVNGVRVDEELATERWVPTPGRGENNPYDTGIWIERAEDGTWPSVDTEDFFDPDKIEVTQGEDEWVAAHPCGVVGRGSTKIAALNDATQQLIERMNKAEVDGDGATL